ncbi:hypothetical protein EVAR_26396_1 [Eumeta japonica]|uniref:Uncharacterized protein n=1 Tax=Eumeta variegata TaxID=151549 RepID=A0A4C1VPZ2_EUMVA|nr:hypothetical protein EVAR_26396_1 [Eumeta japonica]
MCGGSLKYICWYGDVKVRSSFKDVVTGIEEGMSWWFGHLEEMKESGLTKRIYRVNVRDGKVVKGHPTKFYADQIGGILKEGQILSIRPTSLHEMIDGNHCSYRAWGQNGVASSYGVVIAGDRRRRHCANSVTAALAASQGSALK